MDLKINTPEAEMLKILLNQIVIKSRTGEFGIMHGADRFVSTNISLKKQQIDTLNSLASKLNLKEIKKI